MRGRLFINGEVFTPDDVIAYLTEKFGKRRLDDTGPANPNENFLDWGEKFDGIVFYALVFAVGHALPMIRDRLKVNNMFLFYKPDDPRLEFIKEGDVFDSTWVEATEAVDKFMSGRASVAATLVALAEVELLALE